jgi:hypothetical protein
MALSQPDAVADIHVAMNGETELIEVVTMAFGREVFFLPREQQNEIVRSGVVARQEIFERQGAGGVVFLPLNGFDLNDLHGDLR